MKKSLFFLFVSVMLLFGAEPKWRSTLNEALAVAKVQDRIVMVFVESSYCKWCKKMKNRTFVNPKVLKRLSHLETFKVMRDDHKTLQEFPYVRGVPTIFFVTPDKKIIGRIVGYVDAGDFLSYLDEAQIRAKKLKEKR